MLAASLSVLLALLSLQVESADCPAGPEVRQALARLLPPQSEAASPDRARIWKQDGLLQIELVNSDGAVIGRRLLEGRGTCADMATMVAVVIASWESDVHPTFVAPPADLSTPGVPSLPPQPPAPSPGSSFDLDLGAGVSFADSAAVLGSAGIIWIPRGRGPGIRFAAFAETQRSVALGTSQANWRRWVASGEADWRSLHGRFAFDGHAGLVLGWLSIEGTNFAENRSQSSLSPGVALGGRVGWWPNRHVAAWFDVQGLLWLRRETAYSEPTGHEHDLPRFEVLAQFGVSVGRIAEGIAKDR